jgi:hypothetical protein
MDSERKWWPSELLDESMPAGRTSPTEWIIGRADKPGSSIVAGWSGEVAAADSDPGRQIVAENEVIDFSWCEDRGEIDIVVEGDGSYEIVPGQPDLLDPDRPSRLAAVPADATHFWERGDSDTIADSMAQFANDRAEMARECGDEFPLRLTVDMYHWSDDIPHRLVVEGGNPRFEPVAESSVQ